MNEKYFEDHCHNSSDYRVIALDVKPGPGRLDDFIPEVERQKNEKTFDIKSSNFF